LVNPATSAASAVRWLQEPGSKPDLAVLDVGLPEKDGDGLSLCKAIKKDLATRKIPVMILTGFTTNETRLKAAAAGADLILHKPIKTDELLSAVKMMLTLPRAERRGLLHRGSLEIDPDRRTIFLDGKVIGNLGDRLFDLFYLLVENAPRALSRRFILSSLKVKDRDDQVAVMISRLRARLRAEFGADLIATVPGEGYRLDLPVGETARPP
jgi:DNA-binding response OmpR family regulator